MSQRNVIALVLLVISFIVLWPGLTYDLITISASFSMFGNEVEIFRSTRSIIQTIRTLHESDNDFVAGLILLFSVIVPFIKGALLIISMLMKNPIMRYKMFAFVRSISKWAMADVFVVGVYVAFLSAKATEQLDANLEQGFYYFTAYCLISLLSLQFMKVEDPMHPGALAPDLLPSPPDKPATS